jgi:hypothetical protein
MLIGALEELAARGELQLADEVGGLEVAA